MQEVRPKIIALPGRRRQSGRLLAGRFLPRGPRADPENHAISWCCSDCNPLVAGPSGRGTGDLTGPEQAPNRRLSGRNRQRTGGRNESARPGSARLQGVAYININRKLIACPGRRPWARRQTPKIWAVTLVTAKAAGRWSSARGWIALAVDEGNRPGSCSDVQHAKIDGPGERPRGRKERWFALEIGRRNGARDRADRVCAGMGDVPIGPGRVDAAGRRRGRRRRSMTGGINNRRCRCCGDAANAGTAPWGGMAERSKTYGAASLLTARRRAAGRRRK